MQIPDMVPTPVASTVVFVLIVAGLCGLLVWSARAAAGPAAARRLAGATALWLVLTGVVTGSGVLAGSPVRAVGFMVVCNLAGLGLALSPLGGAIARWAPLWALIGVQAFRLPLELVLHDWAQAGSIPAQMTWDGDNLDVITGIVALLAGLGLWRGWLGRGGAWGVTALGVGLLINVGLVAIRSVPGPLMAYPAAPPLLLPFHAPHGWIVPFCVAGALAGHVLAVRKLLGRYGPTFSA